MLSKVTYDPVKDFTPISLLVISPQMLFAYMGLPVKTVEDLIESGTSKTRSAQLRITGLWHVEPPRLRDDHDDDRRQIRSCTVQGYRAGNQRRGRRPGAIHVQQHAGHPALGESR